MKIFLDPGHGGTDPGAVANGILEKEINLKVALKVREILQLFGVDVLMSRDADKTIDLNIRSQLSNVYNADYFISIHHNASGAGADGYEVIYGISGKGKDLAERIASEFNSYQNRRNVYSKRGSNGDYYTVIRNTKAIALITEYAFIDSADVEAVNSEDDLIHEANCIAYGLLDYLGVINVGDIKTKLGFKDATWAKGEILKAIQNGIINSDHDPNEPVTFGLLMTVVNKLYEKRNS